LTCERSAGSTDVHGSLEDSSWLDPDRGRKPDRHPFAWERGVPTRGPRDQRGIWRHTFAAWSRSLIPLRRAMGRRYWPNRG